MKLTVSAEAGKVYVEHPGGYGQDDFIDDLTPDEAEALADQLKKCAADARTRKAE